MGLNGLAEWIVMYDLKSTDISRIGLNRQGRRGAVSTQRTLVEILSGSQTVFNEYLQLAGKWYVGHRKTGITAVEISFLPLAERVEWNATWWWRPFIEFVYLQGWWRRKDSTSCWCGFVCRKKAGSLAVSGIAHSIRNVFLTARGVETSGTLKAISR